MQKIKTPEPSNQEKPPTEELVKTGGLSASEDVERGAKQPIFAEVSPFTETAGAAPADPWSTIEKSYGLGGQLIARSVDRLEKAHPGDVQGIAASQIQLLNGYYSQVLSQAARSFRWAVIAAGVGLLFFLAAVSFVLIKQPQQVATISLISGALIEVCAKRSTKLRKTKSAPC